jgi:hypothetical protein
VGIGQGIDVTPLKVRKWRKEAKEGENDNDING